MRTADQIKSELIQLRFTKRIPLSKIAEDSRCSPQSVIQAMKLEASETIQRRLDAYLDAKNLHVVTKETKLLNSIEHMNRELWIEFKAHSIPMKDVALMPAWRQERLRLAMDWRLKKLLRERVEKEIGKPLKFSDGESYWRIKAKILTRKGELPAYRKSPYRYRPRSMGEGGDLQPHQDKNRKPSRLVGR